MIEPRLRFVESGLVPFHTLETAGIDQVGRREEELAGGCCPAGVTTGFGGVVPTVLVSFCSLVALVSCQVLVHRFEQFPVGLLVFLYFFLASDLDLTYTSLLESDPGHAH